MTVTLGDGSAVIRRNDSSAAVVVADVLGREIHGDRETVYLDRLVHDDRQNWGDWIASGAVSTILTRRAPEPADV
jgi:hypothetical protein